MLINQSVIRMNSQFLKKEKRTSSNKGKGQLFLGGTVLAVFLLLAGQFFVTPVAYFAPSLSSAGYESSPSLYPPAGVVHRTLKGPNSNERLFGNSVAVSGNIVGVGGSSALPCPVYVFSAVTGKLIEKFYSPHHFGGFDWFWESVAASGKLVVVGAPDTGSYQAGVAFVFNVLTGRIISALTSPNSQGFGEFGWSVAVSGDIAIAGASSISIQLSSPTGNGEYRLIVNSSETFGSIRG